MTGINPGAVAAIANWWAKYLSSEPVMDNGAGSKTFTKIYSTELDPVPTEQIELFRSALMSLIPEAVESDGCLSITVDYYPDNWLSEALDRAGISSPSRRLPIKSGTLMGKTGKVIAVAGYSDEKEIIFGED